ncbi:MAG: TetR/AcrR family transcriptional regulator [Saprospiraceae bacterium]|nr:TetR/AcrR family transcriptional regulator [Saprospiraceae bacterium]
MARVKTFDQEEAVKKAMDLFWEKGYESTSLVDLTQHLGIGKGSFYLTFKSKENLFNQCIERYTDSNFPFLDQALASEPDYKKGIEKLLEGYVDGLLRDEKRKGCFMANSCSLVHGDETSLAIKINEHYIRIENYFTNFLEKQGVKKAKAKSVSALIVTFLIGASHQSKINRDKSNYSSTVENIIRLLD